MDKPKKSKFPSDELRQALAELREAKAKMNAANERVPATVSAAVKRGRVR